MFELPRRENVHENEHCRAGVSKTKSKIRTSAEANEGLQLKSDFVIPKGMTVLGVVIPNGKPANKGFRREDRPDPYSERVEERRCLSDALRDEASEHTPAAGLRGRRLRPARGKRRNGFPNDGVSRLDPAVRKKSGSIPAPRRIPRWTAAPTLRSAARSGAAEATCQYSSVTDRGNRMGRAATSPNLKLLLEKETRRCRRPKLSAQTIRASKDGIVPSARSRFTCASTSS